MIDLLDSLANAQTSGEGSLLPRVASRFEASPRTRDRIDAVPTDAVPASPGHEAIAPGQSLDSVSPAATPGLAAAFVPDTAWRRRLDELAWQLNELQVAQQPPLRPAARTAGDASESDIPHVVPRRNYEDAPTLQFPAQRHHSETAVINMDRSETPAIAPESSAIVAQRHVAERTSPEAQVSSISPVATEMRSQTIEPPANRSKSPMINSEYALSNSVRSSAERAGASERRAAPVQTIPRVIVERLSAGSPERERMPSIHVTIGRVEVKAQREPVQVPAPSRTDAASPRIMSLDEYLERRSAGGGR